MPSLLNFLTALCGFLSLLSGCVAVTRIENGTVEIYSDTNYKNRLLTINLRYPNQCYHLDCTLLQYKVESAKWSNLPTTGLDGKAYIVFYEDIDCGGSETSITLPNAGGIKNFDGKKVNGLISSFMIKSQPSDVDNGFSNVCSWASADVVGGSVSQDDQLVMVVPKPTRV
ncbi:hypothetical protein PF005_g20023 [Phytophthora fragariae]|uniref:Uncharacterized protein n=1 Tax=Phytophthora fragariae TaxID=53985 RepID=A0A6A3R6W4_9STRA|nr:hypothetical protein PF003_g17036 [Phytophthora fragariae]KAE8927438.1 hypothetical protein PF009_g22392 [Phytophthora fragariae]KAE8989085.1 hypothetical protein PF011_g18914 [Phytophthora fragariae]KAE9086171.1 hypothetical protein PF010_g20190 [Phytophthora fragariae]KAE9088189.1 hypothetical protein PF007_g20070 [Phytophthora fragariae]